MKKFDDFKIRLSFSGGGFRATFFCLGAYRRLVELGLWHKVCAIDSVSGGSIAAGMIMSSLAKGEFKDPIDFDNRVTYPLWQFSQSRIRERVTLPMMLVLILVLVLVVLLTFFVYEFSVIPLMFYIALLFAIQPRKIWSKGLVSQLDKLFNSIKYSGLPTYPVWSAHATCLNTAKRFRFKQKDFGGNLIGTTTNNSDIKVSFAVACSAAFPQVFAPFKLSLRNRQFYMNWWTDSPKVSEFVPKQIFLSDGGVYDNLGSESIVRDKCPFIILDAGGYISQWSLNLNPTWLDKTVRILNTALDQIIALRRRLIYRRSQSHFGATLILGEPMSGFFNPEKYSDYGRLNENECKDMPQYQLYDDEMDKLIADLRTDLDAFHDIEIEMLMWAGATRMDVMVKRYLRDRIKPEQFNNMPKKPVYSDSLIRRILRKGSKVSILGFLHKKLH